MNRSARLWNGIGKNGIAMEKRRREKQVNASEWIGEAMDEQSNGLHRISIEP